MRFVFLLILFAAAGFSFTVETKSSQLYRTDHRLRADTTLKIGPVRYAKWLKVEDTVCRIVCRNIRYPAICEDQQVTGHLILSFVINDSGCVTGVNFEGDTASTGFKQDHFFFPESKRCLLIAASSFRDLGFRAQKGKTEMYYLPLEFQMQEGRKPAESKEGAIHIYGRIPHPDTWYEPPVRIRQQEIVYPKKEKQKRFRKH